MSSAQPVSLRDRQMATTRAEILDVALEMLTRRPNDTFSHEAIAQKAGMGARTVYRHFPSRAELLEAVWQRSRDATAIRFPAREEEIVPFIRGMFQQFEAHETLIRAMLDSPQGREVRARGAEERRAELVKCLSNILGGLPARRRAQLTGLFFSIYSGNFWQTLRDRGGLSGPDAQEAAAWAVEALLAAARKESKSQFKSNQNRREKS